MHIYNTTKITVEDRALFVITIHSFAFISTDQNVLKYEIVLKDVRPAFKIICLQLHLHLLFFVLLLLLVLYALLVIMNLIALIHIVD